MRTSKLGAALVAGAIYGAGWAYVYGEACARPRVGLLERDRFEWAADEARVLGERAGAWKVSSLIRGAGLLAVALEPRRLAVGEQPERWIELYRCDERGRPGERLARQEAGRLPLSLVSGLQIGRAGEVALALTAEQWRGGSALYVWRGEPGGGLGFVGEAWGEDPDGRWELRPRGAGWALVPCHERPWAVEGGQDGRGVVELP